MSSYQYEAWKQKFVLDTFFTQLPLGHRVNASDRLVEGVSSEQFPERMQVVCWTDSPFSAWCHLLFPDAVGLP